MDLTERVRAIVADALDVDAVLIKPSSRLVEDLQADSLDLADLFITLSEELDVMISPQECQRLQTVGDVVRYLEGRVLNDA